VKIAWVLGLALGGFVSVAAAAQPAEPAPRVSEWHGYRRLDFAVAGRAATLVVPSKPAAGLPWIWRTEFFGEDPQVDLELLARGWCVATVDAQGLYGSPRAMALMGQFYAHVVARYGVAKRVVLEGFGPGALAAFNFAASHPTRVAALYLDGPVLDIKSWPGRDRSSPEWRECLSAYDLTEDTLAGFKGNAIDRVSQVAALKIPIIAVWGESDASVPPGDNGALLEKRYREQEAPIVKPGAGAKPRSLPNPAPIVEFLTSRAKIARDERHGPLESALGYALLTVGLHH
jgi:pimeloyl-ACP methyl ester carboxylesterase